MSEPIRPDDLLERVKAVLCDVVKYQNAVHEARNGARKLDPAIPGMAIPGGGRIDTVRGPVAGPVPAGVDQRLAKTCATCRWCDCLKPRAGRDIRHGTTPYADKYDEITTTSTWIEPERVCRRHGPAKCGASESGIVRLQFPVVMEADWCGEWEVKS